jgi:hypothetical protein
MSIKDIPKKIKPYLEERVYPLISQVKERIDIKQDIFITLAIILIGLAGFGLGKLSALEKGREPVQIRPAQFTAIISTSTNQEKTLPTVNTKTDIQVPMSAAAMIAGENAKGLLVASKTGKKYHFPWCAGASQIAEKNKIWFDSYAAAQSAGYTAAANCPNLK